MSVQTHPGMNGTEHGLSFYLSSIDYLNDSTAICCLCYMYCSFDLNSSPPVSL